MANTRSGPTLTDEQRIKSGRGPRMTLRLSLESWAKLNDLADARDMSRTDVIEQLVQNSIVRPCKPGG